MKRWVLLVLGAQAFTSCAYVQTHKNVEECFYHYEGAQISEKPELYRAGESYFIAAKGVSLSKRYPVVHDTVFFDKDNEPMFHVEHQEGKKLYYPISAGTATVMQREDGYVSLALLSDELQRSSARPHLPRGAQACVVRAEMAEKEAPSAGVMVGSRVPQQLPLLGEVLSVADKVVVDAPATVGYNCLIPVMAPFVFFHRFLNDE